MGNDTVRDLIQKFNNGQFTDEIEPYFNDLMTFLNYVKKYNLLDEIDLGEIPSNDFDDELFEFLVENDILSNTNYDYIPEEFKNHFLLHHLEHNYEWAVEYITQNLLTDVQVRKDGFYLYLKDREDLSRLFCEGRRSDYVAKDVAKQIFSEEGLGHDWYFDYDRKPSDTIDELDDSNIASLKNIIFKEIANQEMSIEDYDSDFFEQLSEEQGTEDYFIIRSEDLDDLLKDENAINELCKKDLEELGSNLRSLYHWAENSAYEDEVYSLVYDGLNEYFEGRIEETPRQVKRSDGTTITKYDNYIKINNFISLVSNFLDNNKGSAYNDSQLDYYGSFEELINTMIYNDDIECIDFRIPEYPDWTLTKKNINEMFHDYI